MNFLRQTKQFILLISLAFTIAFGSMAQKTVYTDAWADAGFNLTQSETSGLEITYSVQEFSLTDFDLKGEAMKEIKIQGSFLPNNEGAPNLPGNGKFIAVPNGAKASYTITAQRTESYKNVNIAPSPRIPKVTDEGPIHYEKDAKIYTRDAFYPASPVSMSEQTSIRGMESVVLGITPFQYNPVTKELIVYRDLKVQVTFEGGNGTFGEDRLRSRWFEPILSDRMINYSTLPEVEFPTHSPESLTLDYEYIIICPDDPVFISWAEQLSLFRNQQGIRTGVLTTTDVGGNTISAIEGFVDNAYYTWAMPPAAVLLLGDYGSSGNTVVSPIWNSYCASDNVYADVTENSMPDVIFARMTAQNETHLETMITKVLDYETDPPTSPDFYNHPITALGWQTERWFQICSEVVGGYFKNVQGKDPVRINAIYQGTPGTVWSTATNTDAVVDYFGPNGTGYIPQTPAELGGWTGGNPSMVTNAINDGAFILQHRDHGGQTGWGEPDYSNGDINNLTNTDLSFIFSINCLTGKYNWSSECFTEKFHRHTYNGENAGALGLIAASEVSYSFVNDTYVWGMFDNMWPDFMPDNQTEPMPRGLLPAFGNAAGKYFLQESDWPYNTINKEVTYALFHHHGCAFSTLYSEVPMDLTINHDNVILAGLEQFTITANDGAFVALSVDGEIIGTGMATGSPINISILPQVPPTMVDVVVTKTNYYRYHQQVEVIPPDGPYVIQNSITINDEAGNNNGMVDYGESILMSLEVKNVGSEDGENVIVSISTDDPYINITTAQSNYGNVPAGGLKTMDDAFSFDVAGDIPDLHTIIFNMEATDGTETWESSFFLKGHAPVLNFLEVIVDDAAGNNNGKLDPDETANLIISVSNTGTADAYEVMGDLSCEDPYLTINTSSQGFGEIASGNDNSQSYEIITEITTPPGYVLDFTFDIASTGGQMAQGMFSLTVGQIPFLILDLDGEPKNSGPHINAALVNLGFSADYTTSFPSNLNLYSNIFVCLGIYSNNHVLSQAEGQLLADFLDNGGNLYMEGGDTWFYNEPTPVHPMFNIEKISDGDDDMNVLLGQDGTFTEGMSFNYGGDNNYMDRITAISPAFNIFENHTPDYFAAVAHDAGSYKTIGSVFEFGGLADGSGISTKQNLMLEYLQFMGIHKISLAPGIPVGDTEVCPNSGNLPYSTNEVDGADYYYWTIEPNNAGTVIGTSNEVTIEWSADYHGMAYVRVCGMNDNGAGPTSDSLGVMVLEAPTATMSGTESICAGENVNLSVTLTGQGPWTLIINSEQYTATASPYTFSVAPTTFSSYSVSSVEDAAGCTNTGSGATQVSILPLPVPPAPPQGPATVNTDQNQTSVYTTTGSVNALSYDWQITPAEAYDAMDQNGMTCTVTWAYPYIGQAAISLRGINDCGEGEYTLAFDVSLENSFDIDEMARALGLEVYPNPNKGSFTLKLATDKVDEVNMRIVNAIGNVVYENPEMKINRQFSTTIDISNQAEGIYLIILESDLGVHTSRIIVQ